MAYLFGGVLFESIKSTQSFSSGSISDVLVGSSRIFVVVGSLNSVYVYNKLSDGTLGTLISNFNWYSTDSTLGQICTNNSSVPYSYALYVEDGKDYLCGWGTTVNVHRWEISSTTHQPVGRTSYAVAPKALGQYGRAGWDGNRYVYFVNPTDLKVYRWDLQNKTTALEVLCTLTTRNGLDSSYTASGMLVRDGFLYHGDGSNETGGLLGCWDLANGTYNNGTMTNAALPSITGLTAIAGAGGTICFSPLHPNIAYFFAFSYTLLKTINISYVNFEFMDIPSRIHDEDLTMRFKLTGGGVATTAQAQYHVLLDGAYKLPTAGSANYSALESLPLVKELVLPNSLFTTVKPGYVVAIDYKLDIATQVCRKVYLVEVFNNAPVVNVTLDRSTIHDELIHMSASITEDSATDKLEYRVLQGTTELASWTGLNYSAPLDIRRTFSPDQFPVGSTVLKVEARDWFKGNQKTGMAQATVTKINQSPALTVTLKGQTLYLSATDPDGDKIRFRISVSGTQLLPTEGWSMYFPTPYSTLYTLPRKNVAINQTVTVKVEVQDSAGDITVFDKPLVFGYAGLMFRDETGSYYSDDIGSVIKLINLGEVKARESTAPVKVYMDNTLGYPVKNVVITALQGDLDPLTEIVGFSKELSPYQAASSLSFPSTLEHGEGVSFYVNLDALDGAVGGGRFKVKATAEPA